MKLESLPFDSLYKFLVSAGIVVTLTCGGALYHEESEIAASKADQRAREQLQAVHLKSNNERVLELWRSGRTGPAVLQELEGIMKDNDKWIGEMDSNFIESAKTDARETIFHSRYWYFVGGTAAGALMLLGGFCFWFFKLQRHIDKEVRRGNFPA